MKQEFEIGASVKFTAYDYYWKVYTCRKKWYTGKVVGYNKNGYFNKSTMGLKRYKIKEDETGGILFLGASRMKKVND